MCAVMQNRLRLLAENILPVQPLGFDGDLFCLVPIGQCDEAYRKIVVDMALVLVVHLDILYGKKVK